MLFATDEERALAVALSRLAYSNPFLPERIDAERAVLGDDFNPSGTLWHTRDEPERAPNIVKIAERVGALADLLHERLAAGARASEDELTRYEELVMYLLFDRHQADLFPLVRETELTKRLAAGSLTRFTRPSPSAWRLAAKRSSCGRRRGSRHATWLRIERVIRSVLAERRPRMRFLILVALSALLGGCVMSLQEVRETPPTRSVTVRGDSSVLAGCAAENLQAAPRSYCTNQAGNLIYQVIQRTDLRRATVTWYFPGSISGTYRANRRDGENKQYHLRGTRSDALI